MKKMECIISNTKLTAVEKALRELGIRGMTVTNVKGFGNEQTRPESFLFLPKTKIELYCQDDELEEIIAVISNICRTGQLGDGKIAVFDIDEMIRIRTGERGTVAV